MTRSQELFDEWEAGGGNLEEYREDYHRDVRDSRSYCRWFPSFVYRHTRAHPPYDNPRRAESVIGESHRPPRENDSYHHLLFKHRGTDTWMHVTSGTHIIVGESVGFKAYVTIKGQSITVGEYHVSTDPHKVFKWAREWMEAHPDGYDGGDD